MVFLVSRVLQRAQTGPRVPEPLGNSSDARVAQNGAEAGTCSRALCLHILPRGSVRRVYLLISSTGSREGPSYLGVTRGRGRSGRLAWVGLRDATMASGDRSGELGCPPVFPGIDMIGIRRFPGRKRVRYGYKNSHRGWCGDEYSSGLSHEKLPSIQLEVEYASEDLVFGLVCSSCQR